MIVDKSVASQRVVWF